MHAFYVENVEKLALANALHFGRRRDDLGEDVGNLVRVVDPLQLDGLLHVDEFGLDRGHSDGRPARACGPPCQSRSRTS